MFNDLTVLKSTSFCHRRYGCHTPPDQGYCKDGDTIVYAGAHPPGCCLHNKLSCETNTWDALYIRDNSNEQVSSFKIPTTSARLTVDTHSNCRSPQRHYSAPAYDLVCDSGINSGDLPPCNVFQFQYPELLLSQHSPKSAMVDPERRVCCLRPVWSSNALLDGAGAC